MALLGALGAVVALPGAASAQSPTLAAAGDIACAGGNTVDACQQSATARVISGLAPSAVATLGDNQYVNGTLSEFNGPGAFNATWGAFKPLIHPAVGNHEYGTPGASGYFDYFGPAAGDPSRGYYSYDLGTWHVVVLNSQDCLRASCAAGSAQEQWLRTDLASHPRSCTLAYWHHPLFTSSANDAVRTDGAATRPLWQALYAAHADLILNGHDHAYERFAPQDPMGRSDPSGGIRELVVGTGGEELFPPGAPTLNSEVRENKSFGALLLTLDPHGYSWRFHSAGSGTNSDSGSAPCVDQPPVAAITPTPASPVASRRVAFDGSSSRDADGTIAGYRWDFGDGTSATGARPTHVYPTAGTRKVTLTVTDDGGRTATTSRTLSVAPPPALTLGRFALTRHAAAFALAPSEPASFSIAVDRLVLGRVSGGRCRPDSPRLAHHWPCRLVARMGSLRGHCAGGSTTVRFAGRVGRRTLRRGRYRATLTARATASRVLARPQRLTFAMPAR